MTTNLNVMDAIKLAMGAEEKARQFYLEAKEKVSDEQAKDLLSQLAGFEKHHYDKLLALYNSLQKEKGYIAYASPAITLPKVSQGLEGGRTAREYNLETVVEVLGLACDAEKAARARYEELAEQTADPDGRAMFRQLAEEEHIHYRILSDELYNLSNQGLWVWAE